MGKSNVKRQRNSFVRGVRAEAALNAYTRALGYLLSRNHDQARKLIEERIDYHRKELADIRVERGVEPAGVTVGLVVTRAKE